MGINFLTKKFLLSPLLKIFMENKQITHEIHIFTYLHFSRDIFIIVQ